MHSALDYTKWLEITAMERVRSYMAFLILGYGQHEIKVDHGLTYAVEAESGRLVWAFSSEMTLCVFLARVGCLKRNNHLQNKNDICCHCHLHCHLGNLDRRLRRLRAHCHSKQEHLQLHQRYRSKQEPLQRQGLVNPFGFSIRKRPERSDLAVKVLGCPGAPMVCSNAWLHGL